MTASRRREAPIPVPRRGWHDEWRVTGEPGPGYEPCDRTWSSLDRRWPDGMAGCVAHKFVRAVLEDDTVPPWQVPPTLERRRIFTGQWEPVDVQPRPVWRRDTPNPITRRQGARA